jgi:hypothetical protein
LKFQYEELEISPQLRYQRSKNLQKTHSGRAKILKGHTGIDTETYQGRVKLICDSFGRDLFLEENEKNGFEKILKFLIYEPFRGNFNWFFNVTFDFESIAKWLQYEQLKELYEQNQIKIGDYNIKYLPKKMFSIHSKKTQNSHIFYDINNFVETSLNNAAKTLLKKEKLTDIVDASKLNTDIEYWRENKIDIIKYCKQDALLTKEIAEHFWVKLMEPKLKYYPVKPYSKGKFAEEYFLHNCFMPTINKIVKNYPEVIEYSYKSYYGGRFELLKRGTFDRVYMYDIKSAYPAIMSNLVDINRGKWYKRDYFDDVAKYGFYRCNVTSFHPIISPFMVVNEGLNTYPNGSFEKFLTQNEIQFIEKRFPETEIEILNGWVFYPDYEATPLKEEIEKLYQWKEEEKDPDIKWCIKIVLNSLYGKFIQTVQKRTGKLFNPMWAANITADTRLKLLNFSLDNIQNVIGYSTDSVHSKVPLKNTGNNLGDFELKFRGEGIFIMSDIYTVWNDDDLKTKFRGFQLMGQNTKEVTKKTKFSLREMLPTLKDGKYEYTSRRPIHLGEALTHTKTKTIEDINIFREFTKVMNINGDKKRIWKDDFKDGEDVLHREISSSPKSFIVIDKK